MGITNLSLFNALRTQMHWHQARQAVLAENVANADTPGYRARDIARVDHEARMRPPQAGAVTPMVTNAGHIGARGIDRNGGQDVRRVSTFETTPEGNSVSLEEEMMKVSANQLDFQTAATVYQRSIGLLRTAIGRR
ncbi:MAG: flagellar basal body rod protein FlgB [Hyphomicrobiaceae bacterium]|nr:flagellar basal body rod protein FlgB [Hyphomicrobiaceae bacterium]